MGLFVLRDVDGTMIAESASEDISSKRFVRRLVEQGVDVRRADFDDLLDQARAAGDAGSISADGKLDLLDAGLDGADLSAARMENVRVTRTGQLPSAGPGGEIPERNRLDPGAPGGESISFASFDFDDPDEAVMRDSVWPVADEGPVRTFRIPKLHGGGYVVAEGMGLVEAIQILYHRNRRRLVGLNFNGLALDGLILLDGVISDCTFEGVTMPSGAMEGCLLRDITFTNADLCSRPERSAFSFANCDMFNVGGRNADLGGVSFGRVSMRACRFEECSFRRARFLHCSSGGIYKQGGVIDAAKSAVFAGSSFAGALFEDCMSYGCDYRGTTWVQARMVRSRLWGDCFRGATFKDTEFGLDWCRDMHVEGTDLRGLTIHEGGFWFPCAGALRRDRGTRLGLRPSMLMYRLADFVGSYASVED